MPGIHSGRCRSINRSLLELAVSLTLLTFLAACDLIPDRPLPTIAPTAAFPVAPVDPALADVPATYTVVAPATPLSSDPFSANPTLEPTPTLRPTLTPSPNAVPVALTNIYPYPVEAPFLEIPPQTTPCSGFGTYFQSSFYTAVDGRPREYHVYLPPCYGHDDRAYPVAYLIHGSIQTDSHWLELGLASYMDAGIASGRFPPFVVVMPFSGRLGNISSGGENSVEAIIVNDLLPFVDSTFCTWTAPEGRSIGGISRGGYWALEIAFRHTDLFGAVSGHSTHLRLETDPPRYNPLVTYATADLSGQRIWLDRGEKDFLRTGQDQLHERLRGANIPHEYIVNPGGHNDDYWAAHLSEYLDWHASGWPRQRNLYPLCNQ